MSTCRVAAAARKELFAPFVEIPPSFGVYEKGMPAAGKVTVGGFPVDSDAEERTMVSLSTVHTGAVDGFLQSQAVVVSARGAARSVVGAWAIRAPTHQPAESEAALMATGRLFLTA